MGQQVFKSAQTRTRRRLSEFDEYMAEVKRLEFKPFGGWNYSYDHAYMRNISFSIWALVTAGSLAVDWREAAFVLSAALYGQETWKNDSWGSGASWVHNIQAGYCFYHYWGRNNPRFLVEAAALTEIIADVMCAVQEWDEDLEEGEAIYSHYAHIEGFTIGIMAGFMLDKLFTKKKPLI